MTCPHCGVSVVAVPGYGVCASCGKWWVVV